MERSEFGFLLVPGFLGFVGSHALSLPRLDKTHQAGISFHAEIPCLPRGCQTSRNIPSLPADFIIAEPAIIPTEEN
jgi:hypothetical protein